VSRQSYASHRRLIRRCAGGVAAAATVALALAGCGGGAIGQSTPLSSGQNFVSGSGVNLYRAGARAKAPNITGKSVTGQHLSLASYRGSVVVLNFWGSWCAPCRAEAPGLSALSSRFQSQGVRFLGIDIRDDPTGAEAFMHTFHITYPSLSDPGDNIALAFRSTVPPAAIPSTLIIDRSGHIAARVIGSTTFNGLKALITKVSAQRSEAAGGAAR